MKRTLAAADLMLVAPGLVFFLALFLRDFLPVSEGTNGAQSVVMWYAHREWALWILLTGLPLAAFVLGASILARAWASDAPLHADVEKVLLAVRAHVDVLVAGVVTLAAALVLVLVALHMATH